MGADGPATGICWFTLLFTGPEDPAAAGKLSFGCEQHFAIIEYVEIESLAQTYSASQTFAPQVHCLVPQSQAVVWTAMNHIPSAI